MTKTLRGKEKRVFCFGGWMIFKLKAVVSDQAIISSIFTLLMFFMVEPLRCGFTLSSLFFQTCGRRASICWMTVCFLLPTVLICQYVTTAQQYHMCAQATNYMYLCLHFTTAAFVLVICHPALCSALFWSAKKKKIFQSHSGSTSSTAGQFWVFENSFLDISTPAISQLVQSRGIKDEGLCVFFALVSVFS